MPPELWRLVRPRLGTALTALELDDAYGTIRISADDLPGDDSAWYRLLPGNSACPGPILAITCHVDSFCRRRPLQTTVLPVAAIWDQFAAPLTAQIPDQDAYSPERTEMFLYHHLLTIQDLRQGVVAGREVPPRLLEAFTAAWAVSVDGRLERRQLPGYGMTECRNRFSRLFSTGGILLPEHWQIFQALWDGALPDQTAVVAVARHLPRV